MIDSILVKYFWKGLKTGIRKKKKNPAQVQYSVFLIIHFEYCRIVYKMQIQQWVDTVSINMYQNMPLNQANKMKM